MDHVLCFKELLHDTLRYLSVQDLMYKDPVRWSFAFQSYVMITMLENHEEEKVTTVSYHNSPFT